jgi:hypothetical protein
MLSGLVLVATFGLVAIAGLVLILALYRVSGHQTVGGSDLSEARHASQTGPKGSEQ